MVKKKVNKGNDVPVGENPTMKVTSQKASILTLQPIESQASVKLLDVAGGTRVEVKAIGTNLEEAAKEATKWYDKLKEKYKEA